MDKYERYWKLSELEERFNSSSGGIRGLASAWLLASLGAIGWIFSAYNPETWPLPMGFLAIVVMTLGNMGITTLWVPKSGEQLDQVAPILAQARRAMMV